MSAAADLMGSYQHVISDLRFVMGAKGVFDVTVDGELIYSKGDAGRHAEAGEILELFRSGFAEGVPVYGT